MNDEAQRLREENEMLLEQMLILQKKLSNFQKESRHDGVGKEKAIREKVGNGKKSLVKSEISFAKANSLFESGNYEAAEKVYRDLAKKKPDYEFVVSSFIDRCLLLKAEMESNKLTPSISRKEKVGKVFCNEESGWAAVITMYKRQDYLAEQLFAIKNQSIPPKQIVVIQNENHMEIDKFLLEKYEVKLIRSSINSLYFRWIVGYLLDANYICVFDDDVIPGSRWIESCIYSCEKYNALIGPSGRRAAPFNEDRAWKSIENLSKDTYELCDWVCNSYFFKKDWIKYITQYPRYENTQKTFDDIQLATSLKMCGGVNTIVPPQSDKKSEWNGHIKREYGHDEHALWKRQASDHADERRRMIQKLDSSGYSWV